MDPARVEQAARLLLEARRTGKPLRELPPECLPKNAVDTNAIVDAVTAGIDEKIVGWKIGMLYFPREVPFVTPLFASRVFASPARVPLSLCPNRRIESEICFRLTADLPARKRQYSPAECAEAMNACAGLELVDTRFDTSHRSIRQMLDQKATKLEVFADHNTTGAFVVGTERPDWQEFDFAELRLVMTAGGKVLFETVGGHAFTDPFLPAVVLVNRMRHRGGMTKGQILVTGSFTSFAEVEVGVPVVADFKGFGTAEATYVNS